MARKSTTGSTTSRSKKNGTTTQLAPVEAAAETAKPVRKAAKKANVVAPSLPANFNIEEEIRRRAYELYLERAMAGTHSGNEGQDWLIAEREVRSRFESQRPRPASFAATMGAGS